MFSELAVWQYVLIAVVLTQVSTISVTVYLHRFLTHGSLKLHPVAVHFFRFTIWFLTGTWPDEWRAIHLWHHKDVDTKRDPHSPRHFGISPVLFGMYWLYMKAKDREDLLKEFKRPTAQDWLERKLYAKWTWLGLVLMLPLDVFFLGFTAGAIIWAVQILWMPFVAGIINGLGHYWGYRNYETKDNSRNIYVFTPFAVVIGGEELHNNHHGMMDCAKLSRKWWEFDSGWLVIRLLETFGLATAVQRP